jgi:hypothetical protein
MRFPIAHIRSVTANLGKKEITFSFTCRKNPENEQAAEDLAFYLGNSANEMEVEVTPKQLAMQMERRTRSQKVDATTGEIIAGSPSDWVAAEDEEPTGEEA